MDCFPVFLDLGKYQGFDYAFTGWGWISEPDPAQVCVCVHDVTYPINIGDCSGPIDHPAYGPYCAGIAGAGGDNPCSGPTATEQSTWGTIKGLLAVSVGAHEP